mgnify:CR=1 FL=1
MRVRLTPLLGAAVMLCPSTAHAELSREYRALLAAADVRQDDEEFLATADLIATVTPGGRSDVRAAVAELLPRRLDVLRAWDQTARDTVPLEPEIVQAARRGTPQVTIVDAPDTDDETVAAPSGAGTTEHDSGTDTVEPGEVEAPRTAHWPGRMDWLHPYHWDGRAKAGLAVDSGNTDQTNYSMALEVSRPLNGGWGFDGKTEYFYTESDGNVTRDRWLVEARGERPTVDAWSFYLGSSYEQDRMSGFDYTAVLSAGATLHAFDDDRTSWVLRAGPGARHRVPADEGGVTQWVLELGSVYDFAVTETAQFSSETTLLAGPASRAEQRFKLTTAISEDWGLELGYRVKHEFDAQPGREETDSRLDFSIVHEF